jgi:hypothetical protein
MSSGKILGALALLWRTTAAVYEESIIDSSSDGITSGNSAYRASAFLVLANRILFSGMWVYRFQGWNL